MKYTTKKNIFIHLGGHKTASSYLQSLMYYNYDRLKENGFLYPRIENERYNNDFLRFETNGRALHFYNYLEEIIKDFKNSVSTKLIFSEENILLFDDMQKNIFLIFEKYKNDFNFKFICYIRETVSYIVSSWKFLSLPHYWGNPLKISLKQFIDSENDFLKIKKRNDFLFKLMEIVGKKNIIIRPYEKNPDQRIEKDFFKIMGFNSDKLQKIPQINFSPNLKQAEGLIHLNHLTEDIATKYYVLNYYLYSFKFWKRSITLEELDLIHEKFHHYELELVKKFFDKKKQGFFTTNYDQQKKIIENSNTHRTLDEYEKSFIHKLVKNYKILKLRKKFLLGSLLKVNIFERVLMKII